MKRELLSDPDVIPDKVKKACLTLLDYIEENEDAFEENAPLISVLEDLADAKDNDQVFEVGTILHHRDPKYQNVQMLVVAELDGDRCWTLPVAYQKSPPPKETWVKWVAEQRKTHPELFRQCGVLKTCGTAFKKLFPDNDLIRLLHDDRYIVKKN